MATLALAGAWLIGISIDAPGDYTVKIKRPAVFWGGVVLTAQWLILGVYEIFFN